MTKTGTDSDLHSKNELCWQHSAQQIDHAEKLLMCVLLGF